MIRVVVLTSRENFVWYSMQEIIPYLEATWKNMDSREIEVVSYNIDTMSLAELTPKLIGADKLIVSCFNYRMCKVIQYIREILKLNLGFLIYAHNLSTIAFWPYRYFTSSEIFLKSDTFIVPSENDKKVLEKVFKSPFVHVVPFFTAPPAPNKKQVLTKAQNIVYVGRISPQKNLHNLLLAYSFLKKKRKDEIPPLILFGKEDYFGSPNMNIRSDFYIDFLKELCQKLKIKEDVYFKGHVDRALIDDFLNEKANLFVSPSLHSDENFGMSALHSLVTRNKTVLSDWGGHSDFKKDFTDLVELMPVTMADYGPALGADTIAEALDKSLNEKEIELKQDISDYYKEDYYFDELEKSLSHEFNEAPLEYTDLANQIYESKLEYSTSPTQIFSGFTDPLFLEISAPYIGNADPVFKDAIYDYAAVPWMTYTDGQFMIDDPQKGPIVVANESGEDYTISMADQKVVMSSRTTCEKLFRNAYLNVLLS